MPIDRLPDKWQPHGLKLRAWAMTDASLFLLLAVMTNIITVWAVAEPATPALVVLWGTVAVVNWVAMRMPSGRFAAVALAVTVGLLALRGAMLIAGGDKWGVVIVFLCFFVARDVWRGSRLEVVVNAK